MSGAVAELIQQALVAACDPTTCACKADECRKGLLDVIRNREALQASPRPAATTDAIEVRFLARGAAGCISP